METKEGKSLQMGEWPSAKKNHASTQGMHLSMVSTVYPMNLFPAASLAANVSSACNNDL